MQFASELEAARRLETAGLWDAAEAVYAQLINADHSRHEAWHAMGLISLRSGNLALAAQRVETAIDINGNVAQYHQTIAEIYCRAGLLDHAINAGRRAVKLAPKNALSHRTLGTVYSAAKDNEQALDCFHKAAKIDPKDDINWNNMGCALMAQGRMPEAEKAIVKAITCNPNHADAQTNLGMVRVEQGRLDDARVCFEAAVSIHPDNAEAHYYLSMTKKYKADDPFLAMLEKLWPRRHILSDRDKVSCCFALGKAWEDVGQYKKSFAAYEEGNRWQRRQQPFDENRMDALAEGIIEVFDKEFFEERKAWRGAVDDRRTPVFIVGMPRSGTSLLEQILSAHPSLHGAGELKFIDEIVTAATGGLSDRPYTDGVAGLTEHDLTHIGKSYLSRTWKLSPKSLFISDKMPANFFFLGLIRLALPNAKIIHIKRDPMDSCFSCYALHFSDSMSYTYDQGTLGRYYVRYARLMRHWQEVLPAGSVLDVSYESLVDDTEAQARRVLEFVGLPWNDSCLRFHEIGRPVKTASFAQARKPVYKTSVARWKNFAPFLKPLLSIVRDHRTMDASDEALLASAPTERMDSSRPRHVSA